MNSHAQHYVHFENCTYIRCTIMKIIIWAYVSDLSSNYLTGTVPTTLMQLTSLRVLRLAGNYFNGPFPSSIGQLTQLEVLYVLT